MRIYIEEIHIEGVALSRREQEELRSQVIAQLGPAPSQVDEHPSRRVADLGRDIADGVRAAISDTPSAYHDDHFVPYNMTS
jgi:hypothetical protein